MTLMELLDKLSMDTVIHVGDVDGSGFYLIGTVGSIKNLLSIMEESFYRIWNEEVNVLQSAVDAEKDKPMVQFQHESSRHFTDRKKRKQKTIEYIQKKLWKEEKKGPLIDTCVEKIKEKEVKKTYRRLNPKDGYNVLLKGSKGGTYWDMDEWNKDHGNGVNMNILYHNICSSITRSGGVKRGSTWAEQNRKPKQ